MQNVFRQRGPPDESYAILRLGLPWMHIGAEWPSMEGFTGA